MAAAPGQRLPVSGLGPPGRRCREIADPQLPVLGGEAPGSGCAVNCGRWPRVLGPLSKGHGAHRGWLLLVRGLWALEIFQERCMHGPGWPLVWVSLRKRSGRACERDGAGLRGSPGWGESGVSRSGEIRIAPVPAGCVGEGSAEERWHLRPLAWSQTVRSRPACPFAAVWGECL